MKKKIMAFLAAAAIACGSVALFPACSSTAELAYTLSDDGTHYIVSVSGKASALTEADILEEYEGLPVTEIAAMAFNGCSNLTSIVIPDSITTIGYSAFIYCKKLSSVTLPSNLTMIPYGIFGECVNLQHIEIPASVTTIQSCAFIYSSLVDLTIPSTVQTIGTQLFYGSEELESVDFQCDLEVLPYGTFYNCTSLKEVYLPATLTEIKGDETVETTDADGNTTSTTYSGAFTYGYLAAGSNYIVFDYELETIYFRGTEEQWNAVTIGENYALTENTQIVCNYQG